MLPTPGKIEQDSWEENPAFEERETVSQVILMTSLKIDQGRSCIIPEEKGVLLIQL